MTYDSDGREPCDGCGQLTDCFIIRKWSVCDLCRFLRESYRIEDIFARPSKDVIFKCRAFLKLKAIRVEDLYDICNAFEPDALLVGGPEMILDLQHLLESSSGPYEAHTWFEALHPFTGGNGHTGRIYWLWQMQGLKTHLGFLETWYQQSLQGGVII